MQKKVTPY